MHKFGFAFPISLTTPGAIFLVTIFCISRKQNVCSFHDLIPDYLFFNEPAYNNIEDFLLSWRLWCWIIWWLSQIWITLQLWLGEHERLASVERIFYNPNYDSLMIDQFLGLNKRKHDMYTFVDDKEEEDTFVEFEVQIIQSFYKSYKFKV